LKSLMLLWKMLAFESASWCYTSATLDWKTVQRRCKHEGLSFLTITLPTYGKDFEKSLDRGKVDHDVFLSFEKHAGLPKFLSGFLGLVFDRTSGVLLDEASIDSIRAIRQLTLMFAKMKLPCTPARERAAFTQYIQCEQDVRESDACTSQSLKTDFESVATLLFGSTFASMDRKVYEGQMPAPKHGPGATAEKLSSNAKYRHLTWPARLDEHFPLVENVLPSASYWEELDDVDILEPGAEIPVRVISVPKTLKTPRIIGIEPAAMQYAQQSVLALMMDGLRESNYLSSMLGFRDQTPNQRMAEEGSRLGNLATLDLSEASDRVSNQHVRLLFDRFPHLSGAVQACRSRKADVPGHGVKRLAKFASMGSAICFPVEAMVFLTIVFLGIQKSLNTSLSRRHLYLFARSVRIYGDDIIVPVDHVNEVVGMLHAFGYVVNTGKSFWNGKFRESCGKEYYDGMDVSLVRVRHRFPTRPQHATEVISIVSLRNQLYWAGYWKTCQWLDERIKGIIKYFPVVLSTSPVLGRQSVLGFETQRIGTHLHNPLVKGYRVLAKIPDDYLDDWPALLKFHLRYAREDVEERHLARNGWVEVEQGSYRTLIDDGHLERAGRPLSVDTKLGYGSAV